MTYEQMLALEKRVQEEHPSFDGVDFEDNEDGTVTVLGIDLDVDIDPCTGYNRFHGMSQYPLWIVSREGELLQDLSSCNEE